MLTLPLLNKTSQRLPYLDQDSPEVGGSVSANPADLAPAPAVLAPATPTPAVQLATPIQVGGSVSANPNTALQPTTPTAQTNTAPVSDGSTVAPLPQLSTKAATILAQKTGLPTIMLQGCPVPSKASSIAAGTKAMANQILLQYQAGQITETQCAQAIAALTPNVPPPTATGTMRATGSGNGHAASVQ